MENNMNNDYRFVSELEMYSYEEIDDFLCESNGFSLEEINELAFNPPTQDHLNHRDINALNKQRYLKAKDKTNKNKTRRQRNRTTKSDRRAD